MSVKYDVIIVGGGPAGAHVALPLVKAGLQVGMIDGGVKGVDSFDTYDTMDFESIRRNRSDQHEFFLGKDISGAVVLDEEDHVSQMFTGRFAYAGEGAKNALPVESGGFEIVQTLAKGGMTEVWGAVSDVLTRSELESLGLPGPQVEPHYQDVIDEIGISGPLRGYRTLPPAKLSTHAERIFSKFRAKQLSLEALDLSLEQSALAILTQDMRGRKATSYSDTEYWLDKSRSVYRARYTIEELEQRSNFYYLPLQVASSVEETNSGVRIHAANFDGAKHVFEAKYVVVAAGTLSTLRILLKSFNLYNVKISITSKPHIITPCVDVSFLGDIEDPRKHSFCQLVLKSNKELRGLPASYSQLYTYKSLLLFKLLNFLPFTCPESFSLLSLFIPSMILVDTRFPSIADDQKTCELALVNGRDVLRISYKTGIADVDRMRSQMVRVKKGLRKLGLIPLKDVLMPEGSTAHYAGGIAPAGSDPENPLRADKDGKIVGKERILVADASLWQAIPSKPPTLTIMANAARIGSRLAGAILHKA